VYKRQLEGQRSELALPLSGTKLQVDVELQFLKDNTLVRGCLFGLELGSMGEP